MPLAQADEVVPSRVIDVSDVPLRAKTNADGLEYVRIVRSMGVQDGESVCRFPPSTRRSELASPVSVELTMPARVLPFRQFVLKVHSRCDLACNHCYGYEHVDQSAHCPRAGVVLHGGEPLPACASRSAQIARALRVAVDAACPLNLIPGGDRGPHADYNI